MPADKPAKPGLPDPGYARFCPAESTRRAGLCRASCAEPEPHRPAASTPAFPPFRPRTASGSVRRRSFASARKGRCGTPDGEARRSLSRPRCVSALRRTPEKPGSFARRNCRMCRVSRNRQAPCRLRPQTSAWQQEDPRLVLTASSCHSPRRLRISLRTETHFSSFADHQMAGQRDVETSQEPRILSFPEISASKGMGSSEG